ncbi:MAG: SpoIIE family protein phosphatase [Candidatus Rifleibacteriota bacterium]
MLKNWKLKLKQFSTLLPARDLVVWSLVAAFPVFLLIFYPALFSPFESAVLDLRARFDQAFLHRQPVSDGVILGIDSRTLESAPHKWPWPGSYWAELLKKIDEKYQPSSMLIDIFFQDDVQRPAMIQTLAEELKRNRKTGLVGIFEESLGVAGTELKVFPPLKALRNEAAFWGISQQPIDSDGSVRTFVLSDYRIDQKHIALELWRHANPGAQPPFELPPIKKHSAVFRFKARELSAPILSLADALDGSIPLDHLRNKMLLIGPNAPILHDYHKTPVGVLTGPELVFNAVETVKSGNFQLLDPNNFRQFFMIALGMAFALFCFFDCFERHFAVSIVVGLIYSTALLLVSFKTTFYPPVASSIIAFVWFSGLNLLIYRFIRIAEVRNSLHEAEICGNIQKKFFPAAGLKNDSGIEIEGFCLPFQFAGGDYYDFIELPDGRIFFILADVSGHGISAAMITTAAKSIVSLHVEHPDFSIESLFTDINHAIRRMADRRIMMSAVAGLVDTKAGKVKIFSAGHLPAHLVCQGEVKEFPIPGLPLGSSKKPPKPRSIEIDLPQTGQLVFYSDGVIEAVNWQNQMFGFENFKKLLASITASKPDQIIEKIVDCLRQHTEERGFQDDLTILVINFSNCKN